MKFSKSSQRTSISVLVKNRTRDYELLGVLLMWLWVVWPFIQPGNFVYGFDTLAYTGPALQETFHSWRSLQVPLWSDEIFGGVPFLGRLGAQGLYFPNLLFSFFTLNNALDLIAALHLLILAVGMLTLVRKGLSLPAPSGSLSAIAALTSGVVAIKSLSLDQLVAIAWLPWILYFLERIINANEKQRYVPGLVLSTSLLILGGHPQYIYMFVLLCLLYCGVRIFETRQFTAFAPFVVSSLFVFGICSLQLVSTYFLNKSSVMSGKKSLESLSNPSYVLQPSKIISGIIGDPLSNQAYQVAGASEALGGLNVLIVCISILGLYELWRRKSILFGLLLSVISVVSVLVAVGPRWQVFRIIYEFIPGFGNARVPSRFIICAVLALTLLSAYGINYLVHGERKGRVPLFLFVISTSLFVPLMFKSQLSQGQLFELVTSALFVVIILQIRGIPARRIFLGTTIVLLFIVPALVSQTNSPARQNSHSQPFDVATNSIVEFLKQSEGMALALTYDRFDNANYLVSTLRPNTNALQGIRLIDGYDGGMWVQERWVEQVKNLTGGQFDNNLTIRSQVKFPVDAGTAASIGIRWAYIETEVLDAKAQLKGWNGPILKEGTLELWENPNWRGPIVMYRLNMFEESLGKNIEDAVIVPPPRLIKCLSDCDGRTPDFYSLGDRSFSFENTSSEPLLVVVSISWSPDWQVYVNGINSEIFPVGENQIGFIAPAGKSIVSASYSPRWQSILLLIMLVNIMIMVVFYVYVKDK